MTGYHGGFLVSVVLEGDCQVKVLPGSGRQSRYDLKVGTLQIAVLPKFGQQGRSRDVEQIPTGRNGARWMDFEVRQDQASGWKTKQMIVLHMAMVRGCCHPAGRPEWKWVSMEKPLSRLKETGGADKDAGH